MARARAADGGWIRGVLALLSGMAGRRSASESPSRRRHRAAPLLCLDRGRTQPVGLPVLPSCRLGPHGLRRTRPRASPLARGARPPREFLGLVERFESLERQAHGAGVRPLRHGCTGRRRRSNQVDEAVAPAVRRERLSRLPHPEAAVRHVAQRELGACCHGGCGRAWTGEVEDPGAVDRPAGGEFGLDRVDAPGTSTGAGLQAGAERRP